MKKTLLIATFFTATIGTASANETNSGVYFGGKIGADMQKIQIDSYSNMDKIVPLVDLNVGYNFKSLHNIPIRVELSYLLQGTNEQLGTDTVSGSTIDTRKELGMSDLMINTYLDIYTNSPFTPYITAGVGLVSIASSLKKFPEPNPDFDSPDNIFNGETKSFRAKKIGFNAGMGINYQFDRNWSADLSAKYMYVDKVEFDSENIIEKIDSTQVMFGVRYSF